MDLSSGSGQTITNNNNNFAYQLSANKLPQQQPPAHWKLHFHLNHSASLFSNLYQAIKFLICCNDGKCPTTTVY